MKRILATVLMVALIAGSAMAATKDIVPRADGEGGLGDSGKNWLNLYSDNANVDVITVNTSVSLPNNAIQSADINWDTMDDLLADGNVNWDTMPLLTGDNINWALIDESVITGINWDYYELGTGGGYTDLTEFVDQTAWRVFYSDGDGDVTELALGSDGTFLKSNGASSAPTFETPAGSGTINSGVTGAFSKYVGSTEIDDSAVLFDDGTNVGIGTSVPSSKLDIVTSSESVFKVGSNGRIAKQLPPRLYVFPINGPEGNETSDGNMANANGIWTVGSNQYIGYCSDTGANDGKVVLGKRALGDTVWTTNEYSSSPSLTCLTNADNHRGVSIAVDSNEDIHVFRNMHATGLAYNKTTTPGDITSVSGTGSSLVGTNETQMSYPVLFLNDLDESLWLTFRDGTSPNADQYFYEYNAGTETWSAVTGTGTAGLMINGKTDTDGVYISYPDINNGVFQWTYSWKESSDGNSVFDLNYISYDTSDNTFYQADGTSQTMPATQANADVIESIAQPSGFLDTQSVRSICTDGDGNINVAYIRDDSLGYSQLYHTQYTSSWSTPNQLTGSATEPRLATGISEFVVSMPVMLCGDNDDLFVLFYDMSIGDGIQVASSKDGGANWELGTIYSGPLGSFRFNVDYTRWDTSRVFNWLFQYIGDQKIPETRSPMYLGEWYPYDGGYADTQIRNSISSPYDVTVKSMEGDVRLVAKSDGSIEFWGADSGNDATQIASFNSSNNGPSWILGNVGIGTTLPGAEFHVGTGSDDEGLGADDAYIAGDLEVDGTIYLADGTGLSGSGDLGAGGGDNITINGTSIDTTAAFVSLGHDIDFTVSDGGAGGPDSVFGDINWSNIDEIDATSNINWDTIPNKTDGYVLAWEDDTSSPDWVSVSGGSGDITDVWSATSGNVNALTAASGDTFNASSADSSIPFVHNTDCSAVTTEGASCWDTDDNDLYVGDGSSAALINGAGGGGGNFSWVLQPQQAKLPTSNPMQIYAGGSQWGGLFDADTAESARWETLLYPFPSGTLKARVYYSMASATSGTVEFELSIGCISDGDSVDVDSKTLGTADALTATVPGTAGYIDVISDASLNGDSCAENDLIIVNIARDSDDETNDTATGNAEIRKVVIYAE